MASVLLRIASAVGCTRLPPSPQKNSTCCQWIFRAEIKVDKTSDGRMCYGRGRLKTTLSSVISVQSKTHVHSCMGSGCGTATLRMGRDVEAGCKNCLLHRNFESISVNCVQEKIVCLHPPVVTCGMSKKILEIDSPQNDVGSLVMKPMFAYLSDRSCHVCLIFVRCQGQTKIHLNYAQRLNMWASVYS